MSQRGEELGGPQLAKRRGLLFRLIQLAGMISVLGTLVSLWASWFWWADFVSHLAVQYFLFSLLWAVVSLVQGNRRQCWIPIAVAVFHGLYLGPYVWASAGGPVAGTKSIRIVALNVLRTNQQWEATMQRVLELDPDVIYLSEVAPQWLGVLDELQEAYPNQIREPDLHYTGGVFLTRLPIIRSELIRMGALSNPSFDVTLQVSRAELRVLGTHPMPPLSAELTRLRDLQLIALANRLEGSGRSVLMGDLNVSPWSPRFGRILEEGNLRDASVGYGLSPTLSPIPTWLGGVKVDHFLVGADVKVDRYQTRSIPYSDHRILILDCHLPGTTN